MAVVNLDKAPAHIPAQGVTELTHRIFQVAKSEPVLINSGSTGGVVVPIFHIPANTLVWSVRVNVSAGSTSTGTTVILGDSDDTDRLMANDVLLPATAGWKASTNANYYTDALDIGATITTTGGSSLTGTMTYYIEYLPDANLLVRYQK